MIELTVEYEDTTRKEELKEGRYRIGRSQENDLVLSDPKLSREHCELRREEGQYVLVDLDSKNGCYVNGELVEREPVEEGDRITIGETLIYFGESADEEYEPVEETVRSEDVSVSGLERFNALHASSVDLVKWARGGGVVLLIGAMVVFGGYMLSRSIQGEEKTDNLLGRAGNFEQGRNKWDLGPGASLENLEEQKLRVLKLQLPGRENRAYCDFGRNLRVTGERQFMFRGRYLARDINGVAGLLLRWKKSEEAKPFHRELVHSVRRGEGTWKFRKSSLITPPDGANYLNLRIIGAGDQGNLLVDFINVTTRRKGTTERREIYNMDPFPLQMGPHGQLVSTVSNGPTLYQSGLRIWEGDRRLAPWMSKVIRNKKEDLQWLGSMIAPESFRTLSFSLEVQKSDQISLSYSFRKSIRVQSDRLGFQWLIADHERVNKLRLSTVEEGERELSPGQEAGGVRWIEIPIGRSTYRLLFPTPLTAECRRTVQGLSLHVFMESTRLGGGEGAIDSSGSTGKIPFRISIQKRGGQDDDQKSEREIRSPEEIKHLIQSRRWGEATSELDRALSREGLPEKTMNRLNEIRDNLRRKINRSRTELAEGLEAARRLNSSSLAGEYNKKVKSLMDRLGNSALAREVQPLAERAMKLEERTAREYRKKRAESLYRRLRTYARAGYMELARTLLREMETNFSNTDAYRKAREFLKNENR